MARFTLLKTVAALTGLALTGAVAVEAAPLQPCNGGDIAGIWHFTYQDRGASAYCTFAIGAGGDISDGACFRRNNAKAYASVAGVLAVGPACSVTGRLEFSTGEKKSAGKKGKRNSASRGVSAQISQDKSVIIGFLKSKRSFFNFLAIRTK